MGGVSGGGVGGLFVVECHMDATSVEKVVSVI